MLENESPIASTSAAPKKNLKPKVTNTEEIKPEKKLTTKQMITDALTELKTRKGVSLYAIKNHLAVKFKVNTEKSNVLIKKTLTSCVEDGTFVQLKGIGASGSFKLAAKVPKPKKKKEETSVKETKKTKVKKTENTMKGAPKKKEISKTKQKSETVKEIATKLTKEKLKETKNTGAAEEKVKKSKVTIAKGFETQKKKATMAKRKSIGSIIKPPKMKPKHK